MAGVFLLIGTGELPSSSWEAVIFAGLFLLLAVLCAPGPLAWLLSGSRKLKARAQASEVVLGTGQQPDVVRLFRPSQSSAAPHSPQAESRQVVVRLPEQRRARAA
jgi:hypothetical protein